MSHPEFPDEFDIFGSDDLLLSKAAVLAHLRAMSPERRAQVQEAAKELRLALLADLLKLEGRE